MKVLFLIISVYLIISFVELYSLYKKNQKKEMWIYSITIGFAFIVSILLVLGVELPKPNYFIEKIFPHLQK